MDEPNKSPRFSRMVIVALIFAVLSYPFSFFAGLPSMLMAIVAERRIKARPDELAGLGYAKLAAWLAAFGIFFMPALMLASEFGRRNNHAEMSRRVRCASNVRATLTAMVVYGVENDNQWPIGLPPERLFSYRADLGINTGKTSNLDALAFMQSPAMAGNITSPFGILALYSQMNPKSYLCPGDPFLVSNAETLRNTNAKGEYWAGPIGSGYLSYSIAYPWVNNRTSGATELAPIWRMASDDLLPVMSDMAPLNGTGKPRRNVESLPPVPTTKGSAGPFTKPPYATVNAFAHNGWGMNVGFSDGHAEWASRPDVGKAGDNIFTSGGMPGKAPRPGEVEPITTTSSPWDTVMVPLRDGDTGKIR